MSKPLEFKTLSKYHYYRLKNWLGFKDKVNFQANNSALGTIEFSTAKFQQVFIMSTQIYPKIQKDEFAVICLNFLQPTEHDIYQFLVDLRVYSQQI